MVSEGTRTRVVKGKRYTVYEAADMALLARARRCIDAGCGKEHSMFTPQEADRRVTFYAQQVAAEGHITRWLAPAPPKPRTRYRTRFAFGDALGRFGQVQAG
jgi:hypothetical protein